MFVWLAGYLTKKIKDKYIIRTNIWRKTKELFNCFFFNINNNFCWFKIRVFWIQCITCMYFEFLYIGICIFVTFLNIYLIFLLFSICFFIRILSKMTNSTIKWKIFRVCIRFTRNFVYLLTWVLKENRFFNWNIKTDF